MNYAAIKKNDIANGPGIRVSLFVSGCRHHCKNCFNREAWDFDFGKPYTAKTEEGILKALEPDYVTGLSYLGGEPFEPENREALISLARKFRERFPQKTLWCYTGYVFEDITGGKIENCETAETLLRETDVLVDGRFIEDKKDLSLIFRGSSNQRIIDVKKSLKEGKAVWLDGVWQRKMGSTDINES